MLPAVFERVESEEGFQSNQILPNIPFICGIIIELFNSFRGLEDSINVFIFG